MSTMTEKNPLCEDKNEHCRDEDSKSGYYLTPHIDDHGYKGHA